MKKPKVRRLKSWEQIEEEFACGDVRVYIDDKQIAGKPRKSKPIKFTVKK